MNNIPLLQEFFAGGMILFTLIAMSKPRLPALLRHFALSSLCLAGLSMSLAVLRSDPHMYVAALLTVLFKCLFIPWVIFHTADISGASMALRSYVRPTLTMFIGAAMLFVAFILTNRVPVQEVVSFPSHELLFNHALLFVSIAMLLLGMTLMITRRDLFSQIIGFLIMENGIAAFGAVAIGGVPMLVETGIFLVTAVSAVVMSAISRQVQELYAAEDTDLLRELTD